MATEIRVPTLGESITEAIVGKWFKNAGDAVKADEPLVELETDKVTVEVPAPVIRRAGRDQGHARADGCRRRPARRHQQRRRRDGESGQGRRQAGAGRGEACARADKPAPAAAKSDGGNGEMPPSPAARKKLAEAGIDAADVTGSGKRGQILKEDVPAAKAKAPEPDEPAPAPRAAGRIVAAGARASRPCPSRRTSSAYRRRPTTRRAKNACA